MTRIPTALTMVLAGALLHGGLVIEGLGAGAPKVAPSFTLRPNDTVALLGGSNIERTRFNGYLQRNLIGASPGARIRVRNFGWEGDTVFEQWRDDGNVQRLDSKRREAELRNRREAGATSWRQQRDWRQQLAEAGATVVVAQFGQMESLGGREKLPAFIRAYENLIEDFAADGRRLVLVSPLPFEPPAAPHGRDLTVFNRDVQSYADAIRELAVQRNALFVDLRRLPSNSARLTENGFQLNGEGHQAVAEAIAAAMGCVAEPAAHDAAVQVAILEMERLWFDTWRPMNWAFLTGDRTHVPYSQDWRNPGARIFPEEMKEFAPLLRQADENIWLALAGKATTPIGIRSPIPVEAPSVAPQSPEEELASFTVLDGFKVNLFASEKDGVIKPIQMRWDEHGRLWVACAVSYPQIKPGEKANDYVLVCEDTDGDGRADKFTKFIEGLFMPSGIELGDGGLYIGQSTELLHVRDTDGDGRADTRRVVLGGFGTSDSHQMINGLNWGFGGELWFTQGHHIYSRVETPFGVETLNRAGVWRWRPRTGRLDPFFQWSSAGANCWGVITTDYGQPFHKSGANVGAYFSTPGLVRSDLAVNAEAMNLFIARAKQVGMEIVGSRHFPDEMQGRFVIGGYYTNVLEQHELRSAEGAFTSRQLPNLIETKNKVFRPVEVRTGPDGALYVADWYNAIIGHYQASYRHPDRDKSHGRIWRVTHASRPLATPAPLATMGVAGLLEQLDSPERWAKYQAKRLLFDRDTKEVVAALDAWVGRLTAGDSRYEYRRLQALSLYEAHETPRPALLRALLRSDDARIRAYATRTLSTWARAGFLPDALALLEPQVADPDALVRLEAIVAASYVSDARAAVVAARTLDLPFNAYHQHALTKTLHVTNPLWTPALAASTFQFDRDEHLIFALQNGWVENNPDDLKTLSGAAIAYQPKAGSDRVATIMRQQIARHEGNAARQAVWLKAFAGIAGAEDVSFVLARGGTQAAVIEALASSPGLRRSPPTDAAQLLAPLMNSRDETLRVQSVRLVGIWRVALFADDIRDLVRDESAALPLRRAALGAMAHLGGSGAAPELLRVIDTADAASLHAAAIDALVTANPDEAAKIVLKRLGAVRTTSEAAPLLQALLNRNEGSVALRKALAKPAALAAPSAKLVLQTLNTLGRSDPRLSPQLMRHAGINAELPPYTKDYIGKIVHQATSGGDATMGRKIYEENGCAACHTIEGSGGKIGPDLSAISRGLPIDMIVTELVWPALNVKEGFEAVTVSLKDGSIVTGFKHTESADTLGIRDIATGDIKTIRRIDAREIQTGGTVMPDGLTATLSEQQLGHLVRFLSELGQ